MLVRALAVSLILPAVLASSPAGASKPKPASIQALSGTAHSVRVGAESSSAALCSVGPQAGPILNLVDYIIPPDDVYYSLLRQSSCPSCPGGRSMSLGPAHLLLSFPVTPCSLQVEVGLFAASGPDACPFPSPGLVLCPPVTYTLRAPPAGGITEFTLPFGSICTFSGKAFLRITFLDMSADCAADGDRPLLVTSNQCSICTSFNYYDITMEDLCDPVAPLPGNLLMSAEVAACGVLDVADRGPIGRVELAEGFPNPSPGGVTIQFVLPRATESSLRVYDVAGSLVKTLAEGHLEAGMHVAPWDRSTNDGSRAHPGLYFYELRAGGERIARRVVMLQ